MKTFDYTTQGTCSRSIHIELNDDNTISSVSFIGGCNGNLKGIGKLVEGMPADKVIERLQGTTCGFKNTSCPDQLARALKEATAPSNPIAPSNSPKGER